MNDTASFLRQRGFIICYYYDYILEKMLFHVEKKIDEIKFNIQLNFTTLRLICRSGTSHRFIVNI